MLKNQGFGSEGKRDQQDMSQAVSKPHGSLLSFFSYISCIIGCPYEGPIPSKAVSALVASLLKMGCDEISLGDTTGVATAGMYRPLLDHDDENKHP